MEHERRRLGTSDLVRGPGLGKLTASQESRDDNQAVEAEPPEQCVPGQSPGTSFLAVLPNHLF